MTVPLASFLLPNLSQNISMAHSSLDLYVEVNPGKSIFCIAQSPPRQLYEEELSQSKSLGDFL